MNTHRQFFRFFLFGAAVYFFSNSSKVLAKEFYWTHFGVRPLAMGNAFVGVADDFNALFYNPAGIARLKEWDGELVNPTFQFSKNSKDVFDSVSNVTADTDAMLSLLEEQAGRTHHLSLGFTPHLIFPGFGFGLGIRLGGTMAIHRDISADVDIGLKMMVPIVYGINILEDRLSLGVSAKPVVQSGVDKNFSIADMQSFTGQEGAAGSASGPKISDFVEGGTGIGVDMGLLFTPIKPMEPTLGLTVSDVGGTSYKQMTIQGEAVSAPAPRPMTVSSGVSFKPYQTPMTYIMVAADVHGINRPMHYSKKFNTGLEWGLGHFLKIQTGLHQGELSGGFQVDVGLLALRFATYAEQLGTAAAQGEYLSDRRFAMQFKLLL